MNEKEQRLPKLSNARGTGLLARTLPLGTREIPRLKKKPILDTSAPRGANRQLLDWLKENFEVSRGAEGNLRSMEGLRGFAVFLVFLVHYVAAIRPWLLGGSLTDTLAGRIHSIGNSGVDLFFVLSGFLIYGLLIERKQPFSRYLARRVRRIYPAFIAVFALYLAIFFFLPAESKIPSGPGEGAWYLLKNFLLLPGIFPGDAMITVAWSLSFEMFFYLVTPLLIATLRLRDWRPLYRVGFFLLLTIVCALNYEFLGERIRVIMFLSGMVLYECVTAKLTRVPNSALAFGLLALGLGFMLVPSYPYGGFAAQLSVMFGVFLSLCLTCFARPDSVAAATFSWAPLRWLGNMSYSYYLTHGLTLKIAFVVLEKAYPPADGGELIFSFLLPVMFAATLLSGAVLFLLIERPLSIKPRVRTAPAPQPQPSLSI